MATAAALGDDIGQVVQLRIVGTRLQQVRHDQQRLQDVAQVVAEPGCEQRQAFQALCAHQLGFHPCALDRAACIADRTCHRRRQARRLVLDDVVIGALLQRRHRILLTHGAGDEDEGYFRRGLAHDAQRIITGKPRHAQVGQHDVRLERGQCLAQFGLALDTLEAGLQARFEHLFGHQLGIFR